MVKSVLGSFLVVAMVFLPTASAANPAVVVVCPDRLEPGLQDWLRIRKTDLWRVDVIEPRGTAEATRDAIRVANPAAGFVMLVGDCLLPSIGPTQIDTQTPTFYLDTPISARFGSTEQSATDLPYGDLNGDGLPNASVGRIPADNADALQKFMQRSLHAEANRDFGLWRRQVHLVAGVGGFGLFADAAIEAAAGGLIQALLPGGVQTTVMYASQRSPFFPGYAAFRQQAMQRFSDGGLAWVYIGHGQVTELDRLPPGPNGIPILSVNDAALLQPPAQAPPLAVMLACYTGAFDARSDCIAERMLLSDGGPVAVIAGARVTMPYGNASLAAGMMDAWFQQRVPRLGEILCTARQQLLAAEDTRRPQLLDTLATAVSPTAAQLPEERREHAALYNLLGDPTMTLIHPQSMILEGPTRVAPGEEIEVKVSGLNPGKLTLELCLPLGQVRQTLVAGRPAKYPGDASCLERIEVEVSGGEYRAKLRVPEGISGECTVRGFCCANDHCSFGAMKVRVIPQANTPASR